MFWFRQHARLVFAEDAIAIASHNFIDGVANCSRQHSADYGETPYAAKLRQHVKDRIRTRQQSFIGSLVVLNHIDGVEIVRVQPVARQYALRKFAL